MRGRGGGGGEGEGKERERGREEERGGEGGGEEKEEREGGNGRDLEGGTKHAHLIIPDHEHILVCHEHLERVHSCASIDQCA